MALFSGQDDENNKKPFQLIHCWNILRTQPNWHDKIKQLSSQKSCLNKKQKSTKNACPGTAIPTTDDAADDDVRKNKTIENKVPKSPMGKKRPKRQLRRGGGDACVEALDYLWDKKKSDAAKEKKKDKRYQQSYALDKERLQLKEKSVTSELVRAKTEEERVAKETSKVPLKRMLEEERIMTVDLTSIPPLQQQYYKSIQKEIISRRVSNPD